MFILNNIGHIASDFDLSECFFVPRNFAFLNYSLANLDPFSTSEFLNKSTNLNFANSEALQSQALHSVQNFVLIANVNSIADISEVSVGQHFYWQIGGYPVHGQVLLTSWLVLGSIILLSLLANLKLETSVPSGLQNLTEYITEFIRDLAKAQIGEEEYSTWVPFLGTIFLFIFVSNWSGALLPWRLIELPNGELAAPTNDINTTVGLALLTSVAYFYAGLRKKGLGYFKRYIEPAAFLLPINILEDFTKPLSLSFRLFGNILADELVVGVLIALVPIVVPIPLMLLGLFTSAIQALVFATLAGAYIGEALEGH